MPWLTRSIVSSFVLALGAVACSAASPTEPESGQVGQVAESLTTCSSQHACCVGASLTFDQSDPFQAQLASWHCTPPRAYEPAQTTGQYWFWTICTDQNQRVESWLAANSKYKGAPWSAQINAPSNAECVPAPQGGAVNVLYDPTCSTCRTY